MNQNVTKTTPMTKHRIKMLEIISSSLMKLEDSFIFLLLVARPS
ncbi:MAG: hypothetical protein WCW53_05745 [Syntrophales bacterium]